MSSNTKIFFTTMQSSTSYTPFNNTSIICPCDNLFIDIADNFTNYFSSNNFSKFNSLLPKLISLQKTYPYYTNSPLASTLVNLIYCLSSMININSNLNEQLIFLENNDLYIIKNTTIVIQNQIINQNATLKIVYLQYLLMYDISTSNGIFIEHYLENARKVLNFNNGELISNKTVLKSFL